MMEPLEFKTEMTAEEIAETCEVTASLLEGNWTQGMWLSDSGRMCIEGALAASFGWNADLEGHQNDREVLQECEVYDAIRETINQNYMRDCEDPENGYMYVSPGELPSWNDNDYRTEQEVLDVLHQTAKRVMGVVP